MVATREKNLKRHLLNLGDLNASDAYGLEDRYRELLSRCYGTDYSLGTVVTIECPTVKDKTRFIIQVPSVQYDRGCQLGSLLPAQGYTRDEMLDMVEHLQALAESWGV